MNLIHPWALGVGLAVVAAPILIHWLTKPLPRPFPLSTIRFVRRALEQRRARHRLRDFLILMLRVAALVLLAFCFARPTESQMMVTSPGDDLDVVRVVLLDSSQSMAARSGGVEAFERARSLAAGYLRHQPGLRATLLECAAEPNPVFDEPSTNFSALSDALAHASVRPERMIPESTLTAASDILGRVRSDGTVRRELIVLSDFQESNWAGIEFDVLPDDTMIRLHSVSPERAPANLAILGVETAGRVEAGRSSALHVSVGNFSPADREVTLEIQIGEQTIRLAGRCGAFEETVLSTDFEFPKSGWHWGQASLVDVSDDLPADDQRWFVLRAESSPSFALVTRQPAGAHASSSYFLERALSPWLDEAHPSYRRVVRIDSQRIDSGSLSELDVIVLDHPGLLTRASAKLLANRLERGLSMLYVAAEPVDAANLKMLADLLGQSLRLPVEFTPPQPDTPRRDLSLVSFHQSTAPFNLFGDELEMLTESLRFSGGLSARRLEQGLTDDVLAEYSDHSPFLVVSSCSRGQLAVLNVDLGASNIVGSSMFVPLIGELIDQLSTSAQPNRSAACGESSVVQLPAEVGAAASLEVRSAFGSVDDLGRIVDDAGPVWRWDAVGPPGVYQVYREAPVFALASAIPPRESDLRAMRDWSPDQQLTGGRRIEFRGRGVGTDPRDSAWTWFATICCLALVGEVGLLWVFGQ